MSLYHIGKPDGGPYCEVCCVKLPEWKWSWKDDRQMCPQCRQAMYLNEIAMHLRGEY